MAIFLLLAVWLAFYLVRVWAAMLVLGALHMYWSAVPPLGFVGSAWLVLLASILAPITYSKEQS
jgi:hypothetical protein